MSNTLARDFQAQLTTTMDSVLRKALFEIMKLFENSLHDHQTELEQRAEEITQLKMKLHTAEIKLTESESGVDRGSAAVNTTQSPKEPEDAVAAETSAVPDIDSEVPDDWCAPLGCETPTKQDASVCHSIKLRSLYIPLWHIPVLKQEVVSHDIESQQGTQIVTRSGKSFSLEEKHKHTQDNSSPVSSNMIEMPHDIKGECTEVTDTPTVLRRGESDSTGKEQENTLQSNTEESQIGAAESQSTEKSVVEDSDEKTYSCNFCGKVFDTAFGQSVHSRSHKRCKGCKRLKCHKGSCVKLKRWLAKKAKKAKLQSHNKAKSTASTSNQRDSSIEKHGSIKKLSCAFCNKKFQLRCRLREHVRTHTGEKPFECSVCSKTFHINRSLQLHMLKVHQDHADSCEINGNLAWTQPLEEIEDNRDTGQSASLDKVQRDSNIVRVPGSRWQTMGIRCPKGFSCLLCKKLVKHKYMLLEHFLTHTGERLLKCDICFAKFRSRRQLCMHRRKSHEPIIQCQKCNKKFPSQVMYDKHVSRHHKNWTYICNLCGKGFFTKGPFKNHMDYHS